MYAVVSIMHISSFLLLSLTNASINHFDDAPISLTENRYYGLSIPAQRYDGMRGSFYLNVDDPVNQVYFDDEYYYLPEYVNLLTSHGMAIGFGSFNTIGPSVRAFVPAYASYTDSFGTISLAHGSQFARNLHEYMVV